jgi:peptide/nickel transport system substrate-binding protein
MYRRSFACLLAGALAGTALAATPSRADDRVLNVVAPWQVSSFDPADTGFIAARMGIAETIVGVEPDGRLVGLVASGWTLDDDRLTWRFPVRAGLRFHDGTPVTPADMIAAVERARASGETMGAVPIASMSAEGSTMVLKTQTPFAPLPAFLTDYAAIVLAPSARGADGKITAWTGTGPYRVSAIDGDRTVDVVAFERGGAMPAVQRARYNAVPQGETRAAMMEAGDADIAYTLLPAAVPRINASGRAKVQSITIPRARVMALNVGLPYFADVRVRQAINLGIDRAGIAAAVLRHPPSAATQLLPPILADWHNPALPPYTRDVAKARALLAEAGWKPGEGGVLTKDGVPFRFTLLVLANRPELPPMAAAMQAQLRELGIDMQIRTGPGSIIPQAHRDGTFQAGLVGRTYVNVPDPIGTILPDFTRDKTIWAQSGWVNPEIRALVPEYIASFDDARRAVLRKRITEILHAELPVIPVSWFEHTVAVSNRVKQPVPIDPFEQRYLIDRMAWAN